MHVILRRETISSTMLNKQVTLPLLNTLVSSIPRTIFTLSMKTSNKRERPLQPPRYIRRSLKLDYLRLYPC